MPVCVGDDFLVGWTALEEPVPNVLLFCSSDDEEAVLMEELYKEKRDEVSDAIWALEVPLELLMQMTLVGL